MSAAGPLPRRSLPQPSGEGNLMSEPYTLGLFAAAQAIRAGRLRSVDLVQSCLERIATREPQVHAWAWLDPAVALAAAQAADRLPARGPLHGVPIAVKDIIDTVDMPTECGSPIYRGRRPGADASCVALARRAGALVLGKTVTTEFAYFAPGPTANPHRLQHTPGGSSSGSAAAVADCMVSAGFGTQTAASVTRPASFCGVTGYKSSLGEFSLAGIKPFAASFDSLGSLTRCVVDAQWLRWALLGEERSVDAACSTSPPRVGLCHTPWWDQAAPDCQQVLDSVARQLSAQGAAVSAADLPAHFAGLAQVHKTIMAFEAACSLAFENDRHHDALSPQLRQLLADGMAIKRAQYLAALESGAAARREFANWRSRWDVLLAPSAVGEAPAGLGATGDPLFSRMWTLLGVPTVSLPLGRGATGLPIGVQLIGGMRGDEQLLACARWVEDHVDASPSDMA